MSSLKEQFLLTRIRLFKDEKAFEQIMKTHFPAVKRFLLMKLPTVSDAEDVYSIAALRVWNYLCAARVESASGLIFTIARSSVAEFYRNRKDATLPYEIEESKIKHDSDHGAGAREIIKEIDLSYLRAAINSLDEQDANLIRWRYLDQLSIREIAKLINKSEGAVSTALNRSRRKLKERLTQKYDR